MAVNLRGMFLTCRAVFPAMKAQKRGKITRALAREVAAFGITVNAITPGMTQSETQVASSSGNYLATRIAGRAIERAQFPADLVGAVMSCRRRQAIS